MKTTTLFKFPLLLIGVFLLSTSALFAQSVDINVGGISISNGRVQVGDIVIDKDQIQIGNTVSVNSGAVNIETNNGSSVSSVGVNVGNMVAIGQGNVSVNTANVSVNNGNVQSGNEISIGNQNDIGLITTDAVKSKDCNHNGTGIARISGKKSTVSLDRAGDYTLCVSGKKNKVNVGASGHLYRVDISGKKNEIHFKEGVRIDEIIFNGRSNKVYLPSGLYPHVINNGKENEIIRY